MFHSEGTVAARVRKAENKVVMRYTFSSELNEVIKSEKPDTDSPMCLPLTNLEL